MSYIELVSISHTHSAMGKSVSSLRMALPTGSRHHNVYRLNFIYLTEGNWLHPSSIQRGKGVVMAACDGGDVCPHKVSE